ncbi:ABC transporter ATP-binding protein [Aureimonas endophytica]|uniref:ABC transporter ATP-binding protein n=1 Tax=Aureimonas endophytica TaxID=2027858 RepID=A0A916ZN76_9HYPH|nr:ABC transporter ATP-binding protein [Aureimonas endophytica]GGE03922.1 ABC transporter ATP-binding protein [Aureimonas endophytica]
MSAAPLEIEDLVAGYGRVSVLNGLSMKAGPDGNVGLFGPNGHGKTTLLRTVSGLVRPRAGRIRFFGEDITPLSPRAIVERGLIHVPQGNRLFPDLSIAECLALGAWTKRARAGEKENRERAAAIFPRLAERWRQPVRTLSGGERQMVSIATGLMGAPRLLLLDEPTLGLSPKLKEELAAAVRAISEAGVPLIVVDEDVELLLGLASHLFLINHGAVGAEIRPGETIGHDAIMAMYFGH